MVIIENILAPGTGSPIVVQLRGFDEKSKSYLELKRYLEDPNSDPIVAEALKNYRDRDKVGAV